MLNEILTGHVLEQVQKIPDMMILEDIKMSMIGQCGLCKDQGLVDEYGQLLLCEECLNEVIWSDYLSK